MFSEAAHRTHVCFRKALKASVPTRTLARSLKKWKGSRCVSLDGILSNETDRGKPRPLALKGVSHSPARHDFLPKVVNTHLPPRLPPAHGTSKC